MELEKTADGSGSTYLVERYWPGIDEALLRTALARLDVAAREMAAGGARVSHLGSLLVADDQVVFSLMRADSESQVREANEHATLPVDRISPTTLHGFTPSDRSPCEHQEEA